jgi:hypothetical protein
VSVVAESDAAQNRREGSAVAALTWCRPGGLLRELVPLRGGG